MHTTKLPLEKLTALINRATDDKRCLLLTDRQLLHAVNKGLRRTERISYRTFQRYKRAVMAYGENEVDDSGLFDPLFADLYDAFMDNEIAQKTALFDKMLAADAKQTRDYKWIMERKFPDLNLRIVQQQAFAEYEQIELKLHKEDMTLLKQEMAYAKKQRVYSELRQQAVPSTTTPPPAPISQPAEAAYPQPNEPKYEEDYEEDEEDTYLEQNQHSTTQPASPTTAPQYADLWLRPDGSRRSKEEFIRAVKMRRGSKG